MRNTIVNHNKVYGEDLGHYVFNAGYKPQEIDKDFANRLRNNVESHIEIGDCVSLIWKDGIISDMIVDDITGEFIHFRWEGSVWEYMETGAPFKYSYGNIKVHKSAVELKI